MKLRTKAVTTERKKNPLKVHSVWLALKHCMRPDEEVLMSLVITTKGNAASVSPIK